MSWRDSALTVAVRAMQDEGLGPAQIGYARAPYSRHHPQGGPAEDLGAVISRQVGIGRYTIRSAHRLEPTVADPAD